MEVHPPSDYHGEELCICCGAGLVTGWHYANCTDPGYTHWDTCRKYEFEANKLCLECEKSLNDA